MARDKDDGVMLVAASAAGPVAALPVARPDRVTGVAGPSRQQKIAEGRGRPRHETFEYDGADRFDRCMPACESRDPLAAHVVAGLETDRPRSVSDGASEASTDEDLLVHVSRDIVKGMTEAPRRMLDSSKQTFENLAQLVQ